LPALPEPADDCYFAVRQGPLDTPIIVQAELYVASIPGSPRLHSKFLLRFPVFRVSVQGEEVQFTLDFDALHGATFTPEVWLRQWKCLSVLASGGTIELSTGKYGLAWSCEMTARFDLVSSEVCDKWISLCEKASQVLTIAGVSVQPCLSFDEMLAHAQRIHNISSVIRAEEVSALFEVGDGEILPDIAESVALIVDHLRLRRVFLVYVARADIRHKVTDSRTVLHITNIQPERIASIEPQWERINIFIEAAKRTTGIQNVIVFPELPGREEIRIPPAR